MNPYPVDYEILYSSYLNAVFSTRHNVLEQLNAGSSQSFASLSLCLLLLILILIARRSILTVY